MEVFELSSYAEGLTGQAKTRYEEKLRLTGFIDPFLLPTTQGRSLLINSVNLPPVEASDIVAYLVLTSFLTTKQSKVHKSLEAYNQFLNCWVKDVRARSMGGKIIVTGRVSFLDHLAASLGVHLHDKHFIVYRCCIPRDQMTTSELLYEDNGEVCCAHCNHGWPWWSMQTHWSRGPEAIQFLWFTYRDGRVTASKMEAACHTDPSNPSQNLIKNIVNPETYIFSSKGTAWGCKHKKKAHNVYSDQTVPPAKVSSSRFVSFFFNFYWRWYCGICTL